MSSFMDAVCVDCRCMLLVHLPVSEPVVCEMCKKLRFANAVLELLEDVDGNGENYAEAYAMFHDKVKELSEHYQFVRVTVAKEPTT